MNEKTSHNGSLDHSASDAILARVAATDPAAGFDASTLSATLVDDAVSRAASAPAQGLAQRLLSRATTRLADGYRARPRFVLGSGISILAGATASVLAIGVGLSGTAQKQPLFSLTDGTKESRIAANAVAPGADSKIAGDTAYSMLMPNVDFQYSASSSLSDQGGSASVAQLVAVDDPAAFLQRLADALGVVGKVHKGINYDFTTLDEGDKASDKIGANWPSSISMDNQPQPSWWFMSAGLVQGFLTCDTKDPTCSQTTPATPTVEDARQQFVDLMKIAGFEFSASEVLVSHEPGYTSAQASPTLDYNGDALVLPLYFTMTWNLQGELISAAGQAVKLKNIGRFETISAKAAVARLSENKWQNWSGSRIYGADSGAIDANNAVIAGGPNTASSQGIAPDSNQISSSAGSTVVPGDIGSMPAPIATAQSNETMPETVPTPQHVQVTIDNVKPTWIQVADKEQNSWIVLGYEMRSGETVYSIMPAIADGLIGF